MDKAKQFWKEQADWSQSVFGKDHERGPTGALRHLEKEAREAYAENDFSARNVEIVDCLFLVYDAARRAGMSFDELYDLAFQKLAINKARKWNQPSEPDVPIEHIRP